MVRRAREADEKLQQVLTSLADDCNYEYKHWVTVKSTPPQLAKLNHVESLKDENVVRCVNVRKEVLDGDGRVIGLGPRLDLLPAAACKDVREPEAHTAFHVPISCEDPLSLFLLAVANLTPAVVWLAASTLVWAFIGLFTGWLYVKRDDGTLYAGSRVEWLLIIIVLVLQGVPSLLDFLQPFRMVPQMYAFTRKVQPELQLRMWLCLLLVNIDLMQPILLTGLSIYIALYLSSGELLTALLNVAVLGFIGSLDTALLKRFLDWQYGSGTRISLAFLDVTYYFPGAQYNAENAFWDCSDSSRQDTLRTLYSEDTTLDKKWEALIDGRRGVGILGTWPKTHHVPGARGQPTVQSVVLDVSLYSWSEVDFKEKPVRPSVGWLMDGASDFEWAYEINQYGRKALLKAFPARVDRFAFSGDLHANAWGLGAEHARAVSKMLAHSPDLNLLRLAGNPIGNEGLKALAASIAKNDTLTILDLRDCDIGDEGARALFQALLRNPQAVSNCTQMGQNPKISAALQKEMQEQIGDADYWEPGRRGVTFNDG